MKKNEVAPFHGSVVFVVFVAALQCLSRFFENQEKIYPLLSRISVNRLLNNWTQDKEELLVLVHVHCRDFNIFSSHVLLPLHVAQSAEQR